MNDKKINQHEKYDTIVDLLISILLVINKKFFIPNENTLLIKFIYFNQKYGNNNRLLESLLKYFNFEGKFFNSFIFF